MRNSGRCVLVACLLIGASLTGAPALAGTTTTPTPTPTYGSGPGTSLTVGGERLGVAGTQLDRPGGVPAPKVPKATSWLIADLTNHTVLAARNAHRGLAPASTLKIFTALALATELSPRQVYTAKPADAAIDGTKVGLVPGSRYTVDDLVHGLLMGSGNDCAHALGQLSGGQAAAVAKLQAVARDLGALDTVPRTTSGLDAPGQTSSAYDLALAGAAALQNPYLAKVMTTRQYAFPGRGKSFGKSRDRFSTQNHNHLLGTLQGATGVKNGYTVAAQASFVGSASRGGHSYLVVMMHTGGATIFTGATAMLDWAFRYGPQVTPVGTLVQPGELGAGTEDAAPQAVPHLAGAQQAPLADRLANAAQVRLERLGLSRDELYVFVGAVLVAALAAGSLVLRQRRSRQVRHERFYY
ncbi:D-alanyl-D-alanine carboxypeptidase family protein [Spongisporangium articulatum]|uniref:D-alanyl-D-alanine carboxypeptidase family protein n=1 Tax=Spongisporangium articulatum TaxID=3362603 RepID=A0ABW8API3_9ACTN